MKIIVDAFGGDNCPLEVIKGCALAVEGLDIDIVLTGIESEIRKCAEENNISLNRMEIVHCDEVITMEDEPNSVLKSKKNSSMAVGIRLLNEGKGDAFISAGNSGALCVGATLGIKRIKGIKRPAFAPVIPTETGSAMLLDGGANVDCRLFPPKQALPCCSTAALMSTAAPKCSTSSRSWALYTWRE